MLNSRCGTWGKSINLSSSVHNWLLYTSACLFLSPKRAQYEMGVDYWAVRVMSFLMEEGIKQEDSAEGASWEPRVRS